MDPRFRPRPFRTSSRETPINVERMLMSTSKRDGRVHGTAAPIPVLIVVLALLAPGADGASRSGSAVEVQSVDGQATRPVPRGLPQPQGQSPVVQPGVTPSPLTPKQQRALLKANYTKMKQDANELAGLAKSLQDELNKSNENVLSVDVVEKADRIEKLAKKIKNAAVY